MQRTLGAAIGKVVSKPSPFGRSLVEVSPPTAHARAVRYQIGLDPASSEPEVRGTRDKATARKLRAQRVRDLAEP